MTDQGETIDDDYTEGTATFGDRLALAREAQGLSQAVLADRLGLRPQTIRNWEDDRAEPRANKVQMLAGFLNVSMLWLMTGKGPGPSAAAEEAGGEVDLSDLISELRELRLAQGKIIDRMAQLERRMKRAAHV